MIISRLFATAGKYGTVAAEAAFACIFGMSALIYRKCIVIPVKEDTRAELIERGYSVEEINEAEINAKTCLLRVGKNLIGHSEGECLKSPEEAEAFDCLHAGTT